MFEDLENYLKKHRGKSRDDDWENDGDGMTPEMLAKSLAKELGGEIIAGGKGVSVKLGSLMGNDKQLNKKFQGVADSLMYLGQSLKAKPSCTDAVGNELSVGDVLKVPGGEKKTVIEIGYKFAILSRTDNQTKTDGAWFETEIKNGNFVK